MKLRYAAWLRNAMGFEEEEIVLPPKVRTVGMLLDWLPTRGEAYERAFEFSAVVMVSVNRIYADRDCPVSDSDEVLFVPPIAGG